MTLPNGKGQAGHTAFTEAPHRCNRSLLCGQIRPQPVCMHHLEQEFPASVPSECLPHPLPFAGLSHTTLSSSLPPPQLLLAPPLSEAPSQSKSIWRTCVCSIPSSDFGPPVPPGASCWARGHPRGCWDSNSSAARSHRPKLPQVNCRLFPFLLQHFIAPRMCPVL